MIRTKIDAIVVVEGKSDVDFLNSFIDCELVTTNGTSVPRETIEYLKKASEMRDIIVLTDPDFPGIKIRQILKEKIPNLKHAYIRKEVSIKKGKVGVAESTKQEILSALNSIPVSSQFNKGNLKIIDLYNLGLIGKENSFNLRKKVCEHFSLGFTNGKTLLNHLNEFAITYKEVEDFIDGNQ